MKTLIELYDERPIENVLAAEVFRPERVVFLCPEDAPRKGIERYFEYRNQKIETVFMTASMLYAEKIEKQLRNIINEYEDCAIDITGGTDAALFAAGKVCAETDIPVFTYSRKKNRFFSISNAEFADNVFCELNYCARDFFLMAGGEVKNGRVDNSVLKKYMDAIDPFFSVFLKYRRKWDKVIYYIQKVSKNDTGSLEVFKAPFSVKGERNNKVDVPAEALTDLVGIGFINDLEIAEGETVSFSFADSMIRSWLRDVGEVLELYTYKLCVDSGQFNDVRCSTIVEWDRKAVEDKVTNEIDVLAVKGVVPTFISCKACQVDTYALNELDILRDRFGGETANAIIVTTEKCRSVTKQRAHALNIRVIDLDDINEGNVSIN